MKAQSSWNAFDHNKLQTCCLWKDHSVFGNLVLHLIDLNILSSFKLKTFMLLLDILSWKANACFFLTLESFFMKPPSLLKKTLTTPPNLLKSTFITRLLGNER